MVQSRWTDELVMGALLLTVAVNAFTHKFVLNLYRLQVWFLWFLWFSWFLTFERPCRPACWHHLLNCQFFSELSNDSFEHIAVRQYFVYLFNSSISSTPLKLAVFLKHPILFLPQSKQTHQQVNLFFNYSELFDLNFFAFSQIFQTVLQIFERIDNILTSTAMSHHFS